MSAEDECGAVSEHGDVCGLPPHDRGLCQSNSPRKHVSSPEKTSKPWFWYRIQLVEPSGQEVSAR
jgi:hypothetical protein